MVDSGILLLLRDESSPTLLLVLEVLLNNPAVYSTTYTAVENRMDGGGVFEMNNYHIQMRRRINENGEFSHYELIVAEYSDGKKKRMAVLTAKSLDSELVEMDCSGMIENVIIDLNREGRHWEGGELNGKPFGFGYEYSEDGNLVYEGFVFEGKKEIGRAHV